MRDWTDDLSVFRSVVDSVSDATYEIWRMYGVMGVYIVFVWSWSCQGDRRWTIKENIWNEQVFFLVAGGEITWLASYARNGDGPSSVIYPRVIHNVEIVEDISTSTYTIFNFVRRF